MRKDGVVEMTTPSLHLFSFKSMVFFSSVTSDQKLITEEDVSVDEDTEIFTDFFEPAVYADEHCFQRV